MSWNNLYRKNARHFPRLPDHLRDKLARIQPSIDLYYPCAVTLRDGSERDCVYLAPAQPWYLLWGIWPDEDEGKSQVPLVDVVDLRESPSRLPAPFAAEIYAAGESGMGYTVFELAFSDGSRCAFVAGNAVDFPDLPDGKTMKDVVGVTPHAGRARSDQRASLPYSWCLFEDEPKRIVTPR